MFDEFEDNDGEEPMGAPDFEIKVGDEFYMPDPTFMVGRTVWELFKVTQLFDNGQILCRFHNEMRVLRPHGGMVPKKVRDAELEQERVEKERTRLRQQEEDAFFRALDEMGMEYNIAEYTGEALFCATFEEMLIGARAILAHRAEKAKLT